jgi:hypothetical protein
MASELSVHHPQSIRKPHRLLLWLALIAPLAAYLLIFPIRARLDKGVVERHFGLYIWREMGEGLPNSDVEWLFKTFFFIGAVLVVLGSFWLVWLALDGVQSASSAHQVGDEGGEEQVDPGSDIQSHT